MPTPSIIRVLSHKLHDNPVAYQNMQDAAHLSMNDWLSTNDMVHRIYVAADDPEALDLARAELRGEGQPHDNEATDMSREARVIMNLMVRHRRAAMAGSEDTRSRLLRLIEEFEWAYPDAAAEVGENDGEPD